VRDIYVPLIQRWLRGVPGLGDECDDLAQEVLLVVVRRLSSFERRREGSFRAWLRQIAVNCVRAHLRERGKRPLVGTDPVYEFLDQLAADSGLARQWDSEHDRHVYQKILGIVRPDFQATTWNAFRRFAIDGLAAHQVARELGMSVHSVLQAKSRVLKRLREEAGDLLE
jgi:RNA polymerase sigma-70 factor (ECF subfamily)